MTTHVATATGPAPVLPLSAAASPWPVFWIASIAVFLVSLDSTMLYAPSAPCATPSSADTHGRKRIFMLGATVLPGLEVAYLRDWLPGLVMTGISVGMVLLSLSGAAVNRLPPEHYAVGSAVNQATRPIGAVLGVAVTVLLIDHEGVQRGNFAVLYSLHVGLALLTAALCLPVDTRPVRAAG